MSEQVMIALLTLMGGAMWETLRRQNSAQQSQINLLFKKHDEDAERLEALRLEIATHHYVKGELDTRFDHLDRTFRDGFMDLGKKFDRLSDLLINHIQKEGNNL